MSNQAYLPTGPTAATIEVQNGKVAKIHLDKLPKSAFAELEDADYIDTGDSWLLPGVSSGTEVLSLTAGHASAMADGSTRDTAGRRNDR